MSRTVVALGDSFSCGDGVGIDIRPEQTWTALLCDALPGARLVNLSTAGARVRDVRRHQLPAALAEGPHLATVMVGLNDVIRSGLSAAQLTDDLQVMLGQLYDGGATVLIARWHDPGAVLSVPAGLRRALALRLAVVNDAVDAAVSSAPVGRALLGRTGRPYVMTLDLGRVPELTDPGAWAVDGIHPSPAGHRAIALSACRILASSGLPGLRIPEVADLLPMPPGPGAARRARWLLSRGLPWLAQHSGRVAPAVVSMAAQAIRDQRQSNWDPVPTGEPVAAVRPVPTVDQVLALACRPAAGEIKCLVSTVDAVGAVDGAATQALPGRGAPGIG